MKRAVFLFAVVLLATGTTAHFSLEEQHLHTMKQAYNANTDAVPPLAASLVGDQVVVAHIDTGNTTRNVTAAFDGVKMTALETGETEDPTVEIWTSRQTLNRIGESENPRVTLEKKLESGAVEYRVTGFFNRIRFSLLESLL